MFPKEVIPKSFLSQHDEHMKYFTNTYIVNMKKIKFYNEHLEDSNTKRWDRFVRLMPERFITKFEIKNITSEQKLVPPTYNARLCTRMSKLNVDYSFNNDENCTLAIETLKTFDDKEMCDQLMLIFEKFENTQNSLPWPYDTEDKTLKNLKMLDLALEYGNPVVRVRKTMFITPVNLYGFVANIEEKYDLFVVEHFPKNEIVCIFDEKTVIKYNFKQNHGQSERVFLIDVFNKWEKLKPKKMVFKNVLFLTHFSASVLRIIASFYTYMSANLKGIIEIDGLKPNLDSKFIQDFWDALNGSSCHFIMCFVELKHVNKGDFFEIITNYNAQLLMQYIIKTFDHLIAASI